VQKYKSRNTRQKDSYYIVTQHKYIHLHTVPIVGPWHHCIILA